MKELKIMGYITAIAVGISLVTAMIIEKGYEIIYKKKLK